MYIPIYCIWKIVSRFGMIFKDIPAFLFPRPLFATFHSVIVIISIRVVYTYSHDDRITVYVRRTRLPYASTSTALYSSFHVNVSIRRFAYSNFRGRRMKTNSVLRPATLRRRFQNIHEYVEWVQKCGFSPLSMITRFSKFPYTSCGII